MSKQPPLLTQTMLNLLVNQSPLHAWTANRDLNPDYVPDFSKEMDIGNVVHAMLLQGESIATVLDFDDYRKKEAQQKRDEARAARKYPVLRKDMPRVEKMVQSAKEQLRDFKDVRGGFVNGSPELSITWIDAETGIHCKAKLDYLQADHRVILDYKTTGGSAHPEAVSRNLFERGYDIQGCWYKRAVASGQHCDNPEFFLVTQETYEPFALSVVGLTPEAQWYGNKRCDEGLRLWIHCIQTNEWPGYMKETAWAQLPPWLEKQWLEKELHAV